MISPGDKAPNFTLPDQDGNKVKLTGLRGQKVVLYFYPKADTPGCTTQAQGVRDRAADYDAAGAVVLGVSRDPVERIAKFADKHSLGFPLLSDADHAVAEAYGVWGEKKNYGRTYMGIIRSAFLVDEEGRVEQAWYKISPADTPTKLKAALGV